MSGFGFGNSLNKLNDVGQSMNNLATSSAQMIVDQQNATQPDPNAEADKKSTAQTDARGRAATILTGGSGLADNPYIGARRTLLGN